MAPDDRRVELRLIDLDRKRLILPLADLRTGTDYELVAFETATALSRCADIASLAYFAGTNLTMADNRNVPVEDPKAGVRLLTRFNGARSIRWIGHQTMRAPIADAPVRITRSTLNAARDLRLSPQHRLFVLQRHDAIDAGRAEVRVRAGSLVDGTGILREGAAGIWTTPRSFSTDTRSSMPRASPWRACPSPVLRRTMSASVTRARNNSRHLTARST